MLVMTPLLSTAALSAPRRSMSTITPMQTPHPRVILTRLEAIFTKICGKNGFMIIFQVMVVITAAAAAAWKIMSLKMTLITK